MWPTMHQTALVRVNAMRALSQLAGSGKLLRKCLWNMGGKSSSTFSIRSFLDDVLCARAALR